MVGAVGGGMVGVVWKMLNDRLDSNKEDVAQIRERIADLYQKLEAQRQRTDGHHLEITKALYERTQA